MKDKIYLIGNWKSNKTLVEAKQFFEELRVFQLPEKVEVVICPPFPYLFELSGKVTLGAQDISPYPFGTYTGAVAADMLAEVCKYVIVGHSERRKYFHETNEDVAKKLRNVLDTGMTPILCIDEPYLESQLAFFETSELAKTIVAYEPLAAIGSGVPDTPVHANEVAKQIKQIGYENIPVLYGGSVTAETVKQFLDEECISGVLVGGASLKPDSWSDLVNRGSTI